MAVPEGVAIECFRLRAEKSGLIFCAKWPFSTKCIESKPGGYKLFCITSHELTEDD